MKNVLTYLFLFALCFDCFSDGGEIGNGRKLRSEFLGLELEYPSHWDQLSLDNTISIVSPEEGEDHQNRGFFSVVILSLDGVQEISDLKEHLLREFPHLVWKDSELQGKKGFKGVSFDQTILEEAEMVEFYLREPGVVTKFSYQLTANHLNELFSIYRSIKWLP